MIRAEALKGAIYNGFATTLTKTGRFSMIVFPIGGATISALADKNGSALAKYVGTETEIPGGVTLVAEEGNWFTSITGSAGGVNLVNEV